MNIEQNHPTERSLVFEIAANVAHIRFNRPKVLNAIDRPLAVAFLDACRTIASDESVRVVVLSGEGHGQLMTGCVPTLMAEFLDTADPLALDAACLARNHPPAFFVGLTGPAP